MAQKSGNISIKNFKKAVNYLKRNGERHVGIIGGEPTRHPRFLDLIEYVVGKGFNVLLFTNGIMNREISRRLALYNSEKLTILLNLNDEDMYSTRQLKQIETTFQHLNDKIRLGYTIYRNEFSFLFHRDMILKYNLSKRLRIGLASPIAGGKTVDFFNKLDFSRLGHLIVESAKNLEKDDILIHFDCGFQMCLFTTEQLGILAETSTGFKSLCEPVIDIDLNLNAHHCFPLTGLLEKPITDYSDYTELKQYYRTKLEGLKVFGDEGKCLTCKYLKRKQCRGWCIARIFNSQNGLFEKVQSIKDTKVMVHGAAV
ncbi:MAG: hypothetical protein ABFD82_03665 [Syntrophaceae bacterium]